MSKCLLHISKLQAFKDFLDGAAIPHRDGRGDWQVMQVYVAPNWLCVFNRLDMPEHFTNDRRLDRLITKFCRQRTKA